MTVASIQRIERRGAKPEILVTDVEGVPLRGPNDLVFGADGTLYFTDPGTYDPADPDPSYVFALRPDGRAEVVVEFERPVFPNGLAVQADGALVWDESYTGRVSRTRGARGVIEDLGRLPGENPIPDGMKVGRDGRLYVADLVAGGIHVLSPDGVAEGFVAVGTAPTNCLFVGDQLFVTDAGRLADSAEASFGGALWRVPLGVPGQPLVRGAVGAVSA
jgi:gluconolactonase